MDNEPSNHFRDSQQDDTVGITEEFLVTALPHAKLEFSVRMESKKTSAVAKYRLARFRVRALVHMLQGWLKATEGWDVSRKPEESPETPKNPEAHDRTDCPRCGETLRTSSYIACEEERDALRLEVHQLRTKYDEPKTVSVAEHYTQFPAGRSRSDGPWSGEAFRQDVLAPELRRHGSVRVKLDGTMGYGSSFLKEAFGGLVWEFTRDELKRRLTVEATDGSLVKEIWDYILKDEP